MSAPKPPDVCTLPPCPHKRGLNCLKCYPVQYYKPMGCGPKESK